MLDFTRSDDCRKWDSVCEKLCGVEIDLVLANEANAGNLGNARNSLQLIAKVPILKCAQVSKAVFIRAIYQNVFIDPTRARCVRSNRRMHIRWQTTSNSLEIFNHPRTSPDG